MKEFIKSRIAGFSKYLFFYMLLAFVGLLAFLPRVVKMSTESIGSFFISVFFSGMYLLAIGFLKHIKYIVIKEYGLKYWSLFIPWGRTLYFDNYIGKVIQTESGTGGSYKVVYLINKKRKTAFKIMGIHYKNFDEMNDAIPLKKISFSPSVGQYFKLLFFERITIPDKKAKRQEKSKISEHSIIRIFAIISAIGVGLFVLGSLVRIVVKLL